MIKCRRIFRRRMATRSPMAKARVEMMEEMRMNVRSDIKVECKSRVRGFFWVVWCRVGGELGEEVNESFRRFPLGKWLLGGCCRVVSGLVVLHRFSVYMHGVQEVKGSNPFGPIIFTRWWRRVCGEFGE